MIESGTWAPTRYISRSSMAWTWLLESRPTEGTSLNMRKRTLKNRRKVLSMSQTRIKDIGGRWIMEDYVNLARQRSELDPGEVAFEWAGKLKVKFECRVGVSSTLIPGNLKIHLLSLRGIYSQTSHFPSTSQLAGQVVICRLTKWNSQH